MITKLDRQRATAAMTKCACGNVAKLNETICGGCQAQDDLKTELVLCETVDDLKAFIAANLM